MKRSLLAMCVIVALGGFGIVSHAQDKKDPDEFGGKSIGEWIRILREHKEPRFRKAALIVLEATNAANRTGLPAVLEAVEKDADAEVRLQAVGLLGRLGPQTQGATRALLTSLQSDKADIVREAAANALGNEKYKGPAAEFLDVLIHALKDPHPGTRVAVASTLRNMEKGAAPAVPALLDSVKNPKEHKLVRIAGIHVASRYGAENKETLMTLVDAANRTDNPPDVREAAIDGLARLGNDAETVLATLGRGLTDGSLELRKASAAALGKLGPKAAPAWEAIKTRFDKAKEADSGVRNQAIRIAGTLGKTNDEAVKLLAEAADKDESNENRLAAIQELGELGSRAKSAVATLDRLRKEDGRANVRDAAAKALAQIQQ